ncbi:MAG: hypothetical protein HDR08_10820 [Lachnospiraceae bacterium]|nr:hypothetical protein [Lachnospiraceae bacterium]
MKRQKFLACLLAGAMVLSMAACGDNSADETPDTGSVAPTTEDSTPAPEDTTPVDEAASIDFEDGNMAFAAVYTTPADAADVELSVVDFNGSKALQVKNLTGKVPYVAFDVESLLGADVAKVATIELTLGTSFDNGKFSAVSGKLIAWSGEDQIETTDDWSVYLASKNPAKVVATLAAGEEFVSGANNIFMVQLKTDNGVDEGNGNATLYIDNVRFLDASGNLLTADSSVAFVGPEKFAGSGVDVSNLMTVNGAVNFEGFATSEGGWAQAGFTMPQEIIDALVPGSVVEIEFTSENGDMWIVMNEAAVGWSRVGDNGGAYINNSKNVAQITYEQIAAVCGDDVSAWGSTMQCEASGAWEVFSVKVGKAAPVYTMTDVVEFSGAACSGGAWAQNGAAMTEEVLAALVPGSVVEINYTSETGNMWIVMNEAAVGWSRVADGGNSSCYGGKCYVTYEQIAAVCGDDISAWGSTMQFESDSEWEVYAVNVGTAHEMKPVNHIVEFEGFACSGDAWAQDGADMPQEIIDALVPGAVVNISYTSESGDMWVVMNGAAVGWSRVADGGQSARLNGVCQVTYEQIAAICGDDVSTWGASMQCESDSAWEVFAVSVGQSPVE